MLFKNLAFGHKNKQSNLQCNSLKWYILSLQSSQCFINHNCLSQIQADIETQNFRVSKIMESSSSPRSEW